MQQELKLIPKAFLIIIMLLLQYMKADTLRVLLPE